MANFTRNQFIDAMNQIKVNIENKGGQVNISASNPTPAELATGVNSIPNITVTNTYISSESGYVLKAAELNGVTLTLSKDGTTISSQTTPSPNGGVVTFNPTSGGEYTITATANGATKWTNTILLGDVGVYNCKSALKMREYTLEEINTICKNHYAQYMFDYWDYIDMGSFVGSTNANARYAYFVSADTEVDENDNPLGATFVCFTPSSYKINNQNYNFGGYAHTLARQQMQPSGTEMYVNAGTLSSSTSGTYYVYDWILNTWEEKTLPTEWTAKTYYYQKVNLTADGAIYAGFSETIKPYVVASKQKRWRGWYKYGETQAEVNEDQVVETIADKLWMPSAMQMNGDGFVRWPGKYKTDIEGSPFKGCENKSENEFYYKTDPSTLSSQNAWYCSPGLGGYSSFCCWSNSGGNVNYYSAYASYGLAVCFCM